MSANMVSVYAKTMSNIVKDYYLDSNNQNLINTVQKVSGVIGSSYEFYGGTNAGTLEIVPGEDVSISNMAYDRAIAYIKDYGVSEMIFDLDKKKLSFDEQAAVSRKLGKALVRRSDQMVIDALNSAPTTVTKPTVDTRGVALLKGNGTLCSNTTPVSADKVPFSLGALLTASEYFNDLGVPEEDRYCVLSPSALTALLSDTNITNAMTNTVKALVDGQVSYFMGFNIKTIGQRPREGGLPAQAFTGTTPGRTSFFYHSEAVGVAMQNDPSLVINHVPMKRGWLVDGTISAGSVAIDSNGIIKVVHS